MASVEVKSVGSNKVKVIKVVREITGMGLKEAKDFVDSVDVYGPQKLELFAGITANEAAGLLQAEGADVGSVGNNGLNDFLNFLNRHNKPCS